MRKQNRYAGGGLVALLVAVTLSACSPPASTESPETNFGALEIKAGLELIPTYCNTCHGMTQTKEKMLAPSLWAVHAHYIAKYPEPEAFVDAMLALLEAPTHESSLMPHAVERYGLMAPVSLSREELRQTAIAIYSGAFERPPWARDYSKRHGGWIKELKRE